MESPTKGDRIFTSVTSLVVAGSGKLAVDESGLITGAHTAVQRGSELKCTAIGNNGNYSSFNFVDGETVVNNCDINVNSVTITNHGATMGGFSVGNVRVNGRLVNPDTWVSKGDAPDAAPAVFRLAKGTRIESVSVIGSGDLVALPARFTDKRFCARLKGSGDLALPSVRFDALDVILIGSGDVDGNQGETLADLLTVSLQGSGDVTGIHACGTAVVTIKGSGDVGITASNPSVVQRIVRGSGNIKVRKRDYGAYIGNGSVCVCDDTARPETSVGVGPFERTPAPPERVFPAPSVVAPPLPITRPAAYPNEPSAAEGQPECCVCMDRAACTCIVPCGHCVLCVTCSRHDSVVACPTCREPVQSILRTYSMG